MLKYLSMLSMLMAWLGANAQDYTLYETGSLNDTTTSTTQGLVLMGGATESDNAMRWFLERANGGDVVVIRTSGSDGYNDYLYSELDVDVNSVRTIVFESPSASNDPDLSEILANAEAIWLAGGNQWTYYSYWNETPIEQVLMEHIEVKNAVIGGTSAGMAVLGGVDYVAQFASVTSAESLANPYDSDITLEEDFVTPYFMEGVVTDTHYDNPDRSGRHVTFISRIESDFGLYPKGIACEEYTAVCIDENGQGRVFGEYPDFEDYAYFIRPQCNEPIGPKVLEEGMPLTWNIGQEALKVYKVPGTFEGDYTFDLTVWNEGMGGQWQNWYVDDGTLHKNEDAETPECTVDITEFSKGEIRAFPIPARDEVVIEWKGEITRYWMRNSFGQLEKSGELKNGENKLNVQDLERGLYIIQTQMGAIKILVE